MDTGPWMYGAATNSLYRGAFECPLIWPCLEDSSAVVGSARELLQQDTPDHPGTAWRPHNGTAPTSDTSYRYPEKFTELLAKYEPLLAKMAEKQHQKRADLGEVVAAARLASRPPAGEETRAASPSQIIPPDNAGNCPETSFEKLLTKYQSLLDSMATKKHEQRDIVEVPVPTTSPHDEEGQLGGRGATTEHIARTLYEPTHIAEHRDTVSTIIRQHFAEFDEDRDTTLQMTLKYKATRHAIARLVSDVSEYPDLNFDDLYNLEVVDVGVLPPYLHATEEHTRHYVDSASAVPDWFLHVFLAGPVTVRLQGTFPAELPSTRLPPHVRHEYTQLAKADMAITISPTTHLMSVCKPSQCQLRVQEQVRFARDNSSPSPGSEQYYLQYTPRLTRGEHGCYPTPDCKSQWRRQYSCSVSGSEAFKRNRVAFCGSCIQAPSLFVKGSNCSREWRKNFHLIFIQTEGHEKCHVSGSYRRQMTSCNRFMTWNFTIK